EWERRLPGIRAEAAAQGGKREADSLLEKIGQYPGLTADAKEKLCAYLRQSLDLEL
ncbi:MAG: hypothetical protein HUK26_02025, partial [Duodenibacillus sp.]|nr:hypothetical protein [Duodenibacillus sp.]